MGSLNPSSILSEQLSGEAGAGVCTGPSTCPGLWEVSAGPSHEAPGPRFTLYYSVHSNGTNKTECQQNSYFLSQQNRATQSGGIISHRALEYAFPNRPPRHRHIITHVKFRCGYVVQQGPHTNLCIENRQYVKLYKSHETVLMTMNIYIHLMRCKM